MNRGTAVFSSQSIASPSAFDFVERRGRNAFTGEVRISVPYASEDQGLKGRCVEIGPEPAFAPGRGIGLLGYEESSRVSPTCLGAIPLVVVLFVSFLFCY